METPSINSLLDHAFAFFAFMRNKEYRDVAVTDLSTRFCNIRHNYKVYQRLVDAGLGSWMDTHQYEVGNWVGLFTPIEEAAWAYIRQHGLALWPQFPVDRFFVDFGNPVVKIALECDGARWHNPEKDAARDAILRAQGWAVFRAPGWRCMNEVERPDGFALMTDGEREEFIQYRNDETLRGVFQNLMLEWELRGWMTRANAS